jgi:hypothetical protein
MLLKSKTCPECAEKGQPDAQVCGYCGPLLFHGGISLGRS